MGTKIFLDINVVIDFFDAKRKEHDNAVQLFSSIEAGVVAAFVSESVLNTTVYVLRKHFSLTELREILRGLLSIISLLPCSMATYIESLTLNSKDIEDAVLYQIALESKMDYFITEDKKDFKKISQIALPAISAKEFLKLLAN